jgi:hypothetical protein
VTFPFGVEVRGVDFGRHGGVALSLTDLYRSHGLHMYSFEIVRLNCEVEKVDIDYHFKSGVGWLPGDRGW